MSEACEFYITRMPECREVAVVIDVFAHRQEEIIDRIQIFGTAKQIGQNIAELVVMRRPLRIGWNESSPRMIQVRSEFSSMYHCLTGMEWPIKVIRFNDIPDHVWSTAVAHASNLLSEPFTPTQIEHRNVICCILHCNFASENPEG